MAKWFLKNHDFIHVNSSVAGKYNKHKQDGSHLEFSIRTILAIVDLQVTLSQLPFRFRRKSSKQIFKMAAMAAIWDFLSQRFELFFYLQVTPMLLTKFQVKWPFSSEEEGKNRFSRWLPSWIFNWNHFSYFYIYKSSRYFLPIFKSNGPLVQENKRKKEFPWRSSWISDPNNLSYFRSTSHPNASYQVLSQMAFQFRRRNEK